MRAAAPLDTATLRERAAASLAANRLYAPAGDNAVEDYLALRERQPGDGAVDTALSDLAPYVIIGAEQATAAEAFPEATRLIDLLARMDAEAPAVPRLREALAAAQATAEARAAEEQANAERLAAEAQRNAESAQARANTLTTPAAAAPPTPTPASVPAPLAPSRPTAAAPANPPATRTAVAANPAPTPVAPRPAAPAPRTLVNRMSPRFPEAAVRRRLEGEVEVALRIRADGGVEAVEAVEVVRADPPGVFDREAVLAVRRWRYAPADAPSEARVVLQFKRP
ncbi:TonB family protein [Silanimonas sp.]|uniref:TonB family protein n=1 Tax=Silanimonas sp. TaxID=1929290 RepID=UPI0037CAEEB7